MAKAFDVMVAGHLCLDIIPRFPDQGGKPLHEILTPGKLVHVEDAALCTGGPVSNTGRNMRTCGAKVCFCARVGADVLGEITINMLRDSGNAAGVHVVDGVGSSCTVVVAPPGVDRVFLHSPGTNDTFGPDDLDAALVGQCRLFHFGYPPLMRRMFEDDGDNLCEVFKVAKGAGATTSCDMALPDPESPAGKAKWRRILEKCLPYIDLFLPSVEEVFYMLHPRDFLNWKAEHGGAELIDILSPREYQGFADELLAMGTRLVALKAGSRGVYVRSGALEQVKALPGIDAANWASRELWAPALAIDSIASATGSGDSAIAGFLTAYLNGETLERTLRYATCLGWQNLHELDALSGIKDWTTTTKMIAQDIPVLDTGLAEEQWRWSAADRLWTGPRDRS